MTGKQLVGVISEKTKIPLSMVVAICGLVVLLVAWGSTLEARVSGHFKEDDARVEALQAKMEKSWEAFHSIDKRLERIEDRMNIQPKGE